MFTHIRFNFKISILSKTTYRFKATPIKISMTAFAEIEKSIIEFTELSRDLDS